jgi:hypothetical protein
MEIRVAVTRYVTDRIAASRQQQSHLPPGDPGKIPGGYNNVAVIRANSMKHMPNFFSRGQVSLAPQFHYERDPDDLVSVDKDVFPIPRSAFQVEEAES